MSEAMTRRERFTLERRVAGPDPKRAVDFLALHAGLSRQAVKDVLAKGGVWLERGRTGRAARLRRATAELHEGDRLMLYYDRRLLALDPPAARRLAATAHYSVWYKPPGLLAQGTRYADHCSILRQVEKSLVPEGKTAYLVHRLDREAAGLMLFAHFPQAAARLSQLFREGTVVKRYRVQVLGDLRARGGPGVIDLPLDGKPALTEYVARGEPAAGASTAEVRIRTGRYHQIRRHFAAIGHPVMGDPEYGQGNKNREGLRLVAVGLEFVCPYTGRREGFSLDEAWVGF